uniref:Zgc:110789 n=1 Tax=Sinocyclocheilus rhinocerous TaxID=307959 RepID=A0A673LKP8_9TELE
MLFKYLTFQQCFDHADNSKALENECIKYDKIGCIGKFISLIMCSVGGHHHYLTAFGGIIAIPLILSQGLCLQHDSLTQSHLISTIFFVSGVCTLLQVTFGVRYGYWFCAPGSHIIFLDQHNIYNNIFILQGSIMVGSLFQVLVGFSGLIGLFMRFIGPLTIAPTISLIGLSLFDSAGMNAGHHWGISSMTTCLIVIFSQYLRHISIPFPKYSKAKKFHTSVFPQVLLGITLSWLICYLLTIYNVLPSDPDKYGYLARTDIKGDVMGRAPWFRFPYPGQWGVPTVSLAGVFGILAGVISSMIESVGDYHACARLSGAPPPPRHAINRGIGVEGIGCLLAGAWGTGNGTTSYSENIGALGITKVQKTFHLLQVGSRMVIVCSGFVMIIMGMFGKIGAIFTTIPTPVIGGMFLVMFGVIMAAGVSNLQYTDMNSSRNIFIFGFSMFTGLAIPNWIMKNPTSIATGVVELDHVLHVLLTTSMFVGGFFGFLLDNTIPGEFCIIAWNKAHQNESDNTLESDDVYGLPFGINSCLSSFTWTKYVPFCPSHKVSRQDDTPSSLDSLDTKTEPNKDDTHIIAGVAL